MTSQAADRLIDLLEALAAAPEPLTVGELAEKLGVHRSIVYRFLQTLTQRRIVQREADGRYSLGWGLMIMASAVSRDFQELAHAELAAVADRTRCSTFLAIEADGGFQCLVTAEPRNTDVHLSVGRLGYLGHATPDANSAPALAIYAGRPASGDEAPAVTAARARGYVVRDSMRWPGVTLLSVPVFTAPAYSAASISVLYATGSINVEQCAKVCKESADTLSEYIIRGRVELPFSPIPESA